MKTLCITPIKHLHGLLEQMESYGSVIYEPTITKNELSSFLKENKTIDCVFCNPNKQNYKLDKNVLDQASIRVINTASTGTNHIDLDCCKKLGIKIVSLKDDIELIKTLPSTSELAFGIMLSLLRKIPQAFDAVKQGQWNYEPFIGNELASLSAGIIGYGRLGEFMAYYCKSFGMKVYVCDPYKSVNDYEQVSLRDIARFCDVISIHVHVSNETRYMINYEFINILEKRPIIINTSRGEIVREKDIVLALKEGKIKGYGTDVIEDEFGEIERSPIIRGVRNGYNILVTPHIGGMTWEGQYRAWKYAIDKFEYIKKYLQGETKELLVEHKESK
jgi:D-3-phosphoglycerate dehydrogenase / 2-oxoglutarate reductase